MRRLGGVGAVQSLRAIGVAAILSGTLAFGAAAQETTISHGVSAFGELAYPPDFEHFNYVNPEAPKGGSIRLLPTTAAQTFNSFNAFIVQGDPAPQTGLLFDSLMIRATDEPDAIYGLVAESVEMPEDRSFAIFRLRPEAQFSDGSPLTAEDVAWTVQTFRDVASPRIAASLVSVSEITVIDAQTIRFDFDDSAGRRDMASTIATLPILSKAWFEERPFDEASLEPPLGSGPYRVGDFNPGDFVTYERREDYWAADLPVMRGQFNFDEITLVYFTDRVAALQSFFAQSYDFHQEFISRVWATGYDVPPVENGLIIRETMPDGRPSGAQGWWFNTRLEKFEDPRVREALAIVFNFERTNRVTFYDLYARTVSPFMNSDLVADGAPTEAELALLNSLEGGAPELALGPVFTPPVHDPFEDELDRATRREATRLLREAGWEIDRADGLLKNADGEVMQIEFMVRVGSSFEPIIVDYLARLRVLGIDANYRQISVASYQERLRNFDYDVVVARFVFPPTPGPGVRTVFHSDGANSPDSPNLAGIASPALDQLILAMENATTREEMVTAARAFDRVFRAGHYWAPHWYSGSYFIAYWDRFGRPQDLGLPAPSYDRGVIATWWVDPEREARLEAAN